MPKRKTKRAPEAATPEAQTSKTKRAERNTSPLDRMRLAAAAQVKTRRSPYMTKAVYNELARHVGDEWTCYVGQDTMARALEVSEKTIRAALSDLESNGHIERAERHKANGARITDLYTLHVVDPPVAATGRTHRKPLPVTYRKPLPVDSPVAATPKETEKDSTTSRPSSKSQSKKSQRAPAAPKTTKRKRPTSTPTPQDDHVSSIRSPKSKPSQVERQSSPPVAATGRSVPGLADVVDLLADVPWPVVAEQGRVEQDGEAIEVGVSDPVLFWLGFRFALADPRGAVEEAPEWWQGIEEWPFRSTPDADELRAWRSRVRQAAQAVEALPDYRAWAESVGVEVPDAA